MLKITVLTCLLISSFVDLAYADLKEIKVLATAYSWREPAHKKYGKLNCLGGTLDNHTIAVDPKVIPLGSLVLVEGNLKKAVDVGSAIKGSKIDIHFDCLTQMNRFGKKELLVTIVRRGYGS